MLKSVIYGDNVEIESSCWGHQEVKTINNVSYSISICLLGIFIYCREKGITPIPHMVQFMNLPRGRCNDLMSGAILESAKIGLRQEFSEAIFILKHKYGFVS